jgi:hypothetical protein
MKKIIALALAGATILGVAACGGTTSSTATKTVAAKPAADTVTAPKTDLALCSQLKSQEADVKTGLNALSNDDPSKDVAQAGALANKIGTVQETVSQLRDEATSPSDQRRLDAGITALGQLHAAFDALSNGNVETFFNEVYAADATVGGSVNTAHLHICGGGSAS